MRLCCHEERGDVVGARWPREPAGQCGEQVRGEAVRLGSNCMSARHIRTSDLSLASFLARSGWGTFPCRHFSEVLTVADCQTPW